MQGVVHRASSSMVMANVQPRTIAWLTVGPTACGYYRCHVPALSVAATGRYRCRFFNVAGSPEPSARQVERLREASAVILQRNLTTAGRAWWNACRSAAVPVLYEIDECGVLDADAVV